jgi:transposase-like protein
LRQCHRCNKKINVENNSDFKKQPNNNGGSL